MMNGGMRPWLVGVVAPMALLAASAASAASAEEGYTERLVVHAGGREREALAWRPAGEFRPRRLVLMLHGAGGDPERIRHFTARGLERAAAEGQWLVVYPRGIGGTWNDCRRSPDYPARRENADDVEFLASLIGLLGERHGLAGEDVIVAGFSNGAHMALRLALERPQLLGGLVMVAAQLPAGDESLCPQPYPPLHLLSIAGTADPFLPFDGGAAVGPDGGSLGEVQSAEATALRFVEAAGGGIPAHRPLPERDGNAATSARLVEWLAGGRVIRQYVLQGAGHVVPQREVVLPPVAGLSAGDIDFGQVVLEFVQRWPAAGR